MITDKMVDAALAAFTKVINEPIMLKCERCDGRGYHHGFGENGHDPDWCEICGGCQFVGVPGEEARAIRAALESALAAQAAAVKPIKAKWVGDDRLHENSEVEILASDPADPNVPARMAIWVRSWPEARSHPVYRSCDLCDVELVDEADYDRLCPQAEQQEGDST